MNNRLILAVLTVVFSAVSTATLSEPADSQSIAIREAKAYFENTLKDPDSATYSDLVVFNNSAGGTNGYVVCGKINAKNSYGGYVGFRPFYFSDKSHSGDIQSKNNGLFNDLYEAVCRNQ